jgi:hypothetical protein
MESGEGDRTLRRHSGFVCTPGAPRQHSRPVSLISAGRRTSRRLSDWVLPTIRRVCTRRWRNPRRRVAHPVAINADAACFTIIVRLLRLCLLRSGECTALPTTWAACAASRSRTHSHVTCMTLSLQRRSRHAVRSAARSDKYECRPAALRQILLLSLHETGRSSSRSHLGRAIPPRVCPWRVRR